MDGDFALAEIGGQSGCPACDAGEGCGAGLFGKLLRRKPLRIRLRHAGGVTAGQAVSLGLREALFLHLVLRLYGWPVLAGLAGGLGGQLIAVQLGAGPGASDLAVLAGGLGMAGLALNLSGRASRPDIRSNDITLLNTGPEQPACGGEMRSNQRHEV